MRSLSTDKIVLLIIGGFTALVLVLIFIVSVNENKQAQGASGIVSYTANENERPKVTVSGSLGDLGTMKVKDEKRAQFTIENTGTKPLSLSKISTSCDCTSGQITINGQKGPELSMHSKNPWVGTINPGEKAVLEAIYRPFIMPVAGPVTRDVYVSTNDPDNPRLTFTVKAIVE